MVGIHFLAVETDGTGPLIAAGWLLHIYIEFKRRNLVQFKQEVHYVGKTSNRCRIGFITQDKGRRRIKMFCQFVHDINGNLDFSGFILLHGAQRFTE